MKIPFFLVCGLQLLITQAQLTQSALPFKEKKIVASARAIEQNTLPFWDDFSITEDGPPDELRVWGTDTTRQWGDSTRGVYVNSTLAKNPPSYKTITFDGLDINGQIYADGSGLTDQLCSDTLDLSGYTISNGIYISFYWQAGGNVEPPDVKDSIRLQFYNQSADTTGGEPWQRVWSRTGSEDLPNDIFFQETFRLDDRFINNISMFRFQSFGDQDGPFDAWHLDWIYINSDRENDQFFYLDRGLTGQLTSPFSPFKAIPTHQLRSGSITEGLQTIQTFNLDNQVQPAELILTLRNTADNSLYYSLLLESVNPQRGNSDARMITNTLDFLFDNIDLTSIPIVDSLNLESTVYIAESDDGFLQGTNINLRINDTVRTQYLLHDYFAYDDGTAEYAVGTNQQGDQIGIQFWVNEPDTLTQVDIHFPNIEPDSDAETLVLRIYRNLDDPLPMRSESISISTAKAPNEFTSYVLSRPVIVSDTFYITYEQNVNRYIGIGLDRSNSAASPYIFQNITGEWERNDRIEGAMMIRPVFKSVSDFTLQVEDSAVDFTVFPNPTNGLITINGHYTIVELRNLSGQLIRKEERLEKHDFSDLPRGLYLLSINNGSSIKTKKIVLE